MGGVHVQWDWVMASADTASPLPALLQEARPGARLASRLSALRLGGYLRGGGWGGHL